MKDQPNNRLLGYEEAKQEPSGSDDASQQTDRGLFVRSSLIMFGQLIENSKLMAAYLLEECRREGYWSDHYSSFREYVEEEVGIPMRTAQELMRVAAKCREANVSPELVAELGWSKVALVASRLTSENAAELLSQVKAKSYSQLQEVMRQLKRKVAQPGKKRKADKKREESPVVLSKGVQEALRLACLHTRDQTTEVNLEFIAAKFMELCPPPSRLPPSASLN